MMTTSIVTSTPLRCGQQHISDRGAPRRNDTGWLAHPRQEEKHARAHQQILGTLRVDLLAAQLETEGLAEPIGCLASHVALALHLHAHPMRHNLSSKQHEQTRQPSPRTAGATPPNHAQVAVAHSAPPAPPPRQAAERSARSSPRPYSLPTLRPPRRASAAGLLCTRDAPRPLVRDGEVYRSLIRSAGLSHSGLIPISIPPFFSSFGIPRRPCGRGHAQLFVLPRPRPGARGGRPDRSNRGATHSQNRQNENRDWGLD